MLFRDVVELIAVERSRDADGFPVSVETRTEVFADVRAVKRSEFYAAYQAGMSLSLTFVVRACDYGGQGLVAHEGRRYRVERTYTKDEEMVELNCAEEGGREP